MSPSQTWASWSIAQNLNQPCGCNRGSDVYPKENMTQLSNSQIKSLRNRTLFWSLFALSLMPHSTAYAVIGAKEPSIDSDVQRVHGTRTMRHFEHYRVHEIADPARTVREYVAENGTIFAVTWRGVGQPDLGQLFGNYYQEYLDAEKTTSTPAGRMPKKIQSSHMVVQKFGRMGDVQGKAYIPSLLPDGFNLKSLQ
jgi:hypothetical protein